MVRSSIGHYCFVTILYNETTGAEAKPGEDMMVLHCKKAKLFITGEVFPLDIGLLMGDIGLLMGGLLMGAEC
jgi:hypothetical protein